MRWGGEADDTFNRIDIKKLRISRPSQAVGRCRMVKHDQLERAREEDIIKSLDYAVKDIVIDRLHTFITVDVSIALKWKDVTVCVCVCAYMSDPSILRHSTLS